ncbi:MAG: nucleotidyltransferase domain-containing protein [Bacteroidota bacterium]|nr:nucleotidyltransferase domain-containing protein [Prolixibacteraceae bacterium]MDI9564527.1 nucleotidyltransferase domain-containing protein [Bacteroidota bacterium]
MNKIGLLGSFSDDSYTEESDIDLLVEFEKLPDENISR